jgi:hypothetical protein
MSIRIHIERVVLEGIASDQARGVRKAMESELTRLLGAGGLSGELRRGGAVPKLTGGTIAIGGRRHNQRLGTQLAGAVYHGLGSKE